MHTVTKLPSWSLVLILSVGCLWPASHLAHAAEQAPAPVSTALESTSAAISSGPRAYPVIMLLTDFGTRGYLLGGLKGSIYKAFPQARIDSLSHDIPKFDIDEAAQTLVLSSGDYPAGTLFVVVVDPGAGRPRTPIALETRNGLIFLAPDNGVLTQVAIRYGVKRVHEITSPLVVNAAPEESTFLSRDVLGPAAAALAQGFDLAKLGASRSEIYLLSASDARMIDGRLEGTVTLVDGFGNAHTNIRREHLTRLGIKEGDTLALQVGKRKVNVRLVRTYGDVPKGEPLVLFGNLDEVQLAINQGNVSKSWGIEKGAEIQLRQP